MERGILVVVSGPSGCGKGTVLGRLMQLCGDFAYSVSATTRAPRPGEIDGVNYHFITKEDFRTRIDAGEMLEYAVFSDNYYGTPKKEAEAVLDSGKNLILEIETKGAMQIKEKYPDAVLVMLLPPDSATQEARLRGRGTETEEEIRKRLAATVLEIDTIPRYDYVVINRDGEIDEAARAILGIVSAEKHAAKRNTEIQKNFFNR